jgi:hypothetical protein
LGERDSPIKLLDYSLLRHSVFYFLGILSLSFLLFLLFNVCFFDISMIVIKCIIIFSIFMPWINFLSYIVIIRKKRTKVHKHINNESIILKRKCEELNKEIQDLIGSNRLSAKLTSSNDGNA